MQPRRLRLRALSQLVMPNPDQECLCNTDNGLIKAKFIRNYLKEKLVREAVCVSNRVFHFAQLFPKILFGFNLKK